MPFTPEERNALIEECAQAARQADRTGREWVGDSLWDRIASLAADEVRKLKSK